MTELTKTEVLDEIVVGSIRTINHNLNTALDGVITDEVERARLKGGLYAEVTVCIAGLIPDHIVKASFNKSVRSLLGPRILAGIIDDETIDQIVTACVGPTNEGVKSYTVENLHRQKTAKAIAS